MQTLTPEGRARIAEIARRHGISDDAALEMLQALGRGGGTMAQFSHPDFGGAGQWMQGGMTMVSDLFNNSLKARVDAVCSELAALLASASDWLWLPAPVATPGQGGFSGRGPAGTWWPAVLGVPDATGAQNDIRYAWFRAARRLAIDIAGTLTVYDTGDHVISGVSQQQGNGWTVTFTSQFGTVPVDRLGIVSPGIVSPGVAVREAAPVGNIPQVVAVDSPAATAAPGTAPTAAALGGSRWTFGAPGGDRFGTVVLVTDGSIGSDASLRARYWSVEDDALWFFDSDGRPLARFTVITQQGADRVITGQDPAMPSVALELRASGTPSPTPSPATESSAIPVPLAGTVWALCDPAGSVLATLTFGADGRITGGGPAEARWRSEGDLLLLLHGSGRPTVWFDSYQYRAAPHRFGPGRDDASAGIEPGWTLTGALVVDPNAVRLLRAR
ncbi:MAG: hypothetical protein P4M00_00830 [Azospirillaceae bacterium]|nr:hypothetical protein [Azospirillaceae bacterium]